MVYARFRRFPSRQPFAPQTAILGSISPFFLEDDDEPQRWMISCRAGNAQTPADVLVGAQEDEQMHRRATAVRDFCHRSTYTDVPDAEHQLWHPNYLQAIKAALDRVDTSASDSTPSHDEVTEIAEKRGGGRNEAQKVWDCSRFDLRPLPFPAGSVIRSIESDEQHMGRQHH